MIIVINIRRNCQTMHSSTICQYPPLSVVFLCLCDTIRYYQEVPILLYLLGQTATWQHSTNPLDSNWPCTVINDHDWRLGNCPLPNNLYHLLCYWNRICYRYWWVCLGSLFEWWYLHGQRQRIRMFMRQWVQWDTLWDR